MGLVQGFTKQGTFGKVLGALRGRELVAGATAGGLGQGLVKVPAPSKRGPLAGFHVSHFWAVSPNFLRVVRPSRSCSHFLAMQNELCNPFARLFALVAWHILLLTSSIKPGSCFPLT